MSSSSTSIICSDLSKIQGTDAPLTARLLDEFDSPVVGKQLQFTVNGVSYTRTTDADGYASMNINLLVGEYPVTIRFNGDSYFESSNASVNVSVTPKLDAYFIVSDFTKTYGTGTPFTARLLYNNQPLTGETVVIRINGVDYNRTTDGDGYVSLGINLLPGAYTTKLSYNSNPVYGAVTKEVLVRVNDKLAIDKTNIDCTSRTFKWNVTDRQCNTRAQH